MTDAITDKERMDWLEANYKGTHALQPGDCYVGITRVERVGFKVYKIINDARNDPQYAFKPCYGSTLRDAIDKAMIRTKAK